MNREPKRVIKTYVGLTLTSTLATSIIWGVNTLFLLDAGLNNLQAFAANAFFTVGQVMFEVPTGVVADTWGRRASYLIGSVTLFASTLLYLLLWQVGAPFWQWAAASVLLGLGFTFFSGATEAWLVDALKAAKFKNSLESVFAKGQIAFGVAMVIGAVLGGALAQITNLGVPYLARELLLVMTFGVAFVYMRDEGFTPERSKTPLREVQKLLRSSIKHGLGNRPVRWIMLAGPFSAGTSYYGFYAMQPYLLELYGDSTAYIISGIGASLLAGSLIVGGLLATKVRRFFRHRTQLMFVAAFANVVLLALVGWLDNFWLVLVLMWIWGLVYALNGPIRQTYINGLIPSSQRATVLSFDNMVSSAGGVGSQPVLGRAADIYSYSTSYLFASVIQLAALPFVALARRENAKSDQIKT